MPDKQNPKDRHHHVWQHYLRAWSTDGTLWCRRGDNIFRSGTSVVAIERGFYKLENLTSRERLHVKALVSGGYPEAVEFCNNLLVNFMLPFDMYEKEIINGPNEELARFVARHSSEALEEYHCNIEASMIPYLAQAQKGDISFYNDEDKSIDFFNYLATQFIRTKPIRERVIAQTQDQKQLDVGRVWNVLSFMFGARIGMTLYGQREKRALRLIKNDSDVEFITGDQPAINLHATWTPDHPNELSIYYPISPKLALLLADVDKEPLYPEYIDSDQAGELNDKLREACYSQLFGATESVLKDL
jgi:hypothetical protein